MFFGFELGAEREGVFGALGEVGFEMIDTSCKYNLRGVIKRFDGVG